MGNLLDESYRDRKRILIGHDGSDLSLLKEGVSDHEALVAVADYNDLINHKVDLLVVGNGVTRHLFEKQAVVRIAVFHENSKQILVAESRLQELKNSKAFLLVIIKFLDHFNDMVFYPEFALPLNLVNAYQESKLANIYSSDGFD